MSRSTLILTVREGNKLKQSLDLECYHIFVEDTKFQDAFWDCSEYEAPLGEGNPSTIDKMQWFPAKDGIKYFKHIKNMIADPENIPEAIVDEVPDLVEEVDKAIRLLTEAAKQELTFHLTFCE